MRNESKRLAVTTLGCKVNQYDTDSVVTQFVQAGYSIVDFQDLADVYLVNTCTVTNLGDRKSRQMIRRAHKRNPEAKVVVMGCPAQTAPEDVSVLDGVSLVVGTNGRSRIVEEVESLGWGNSVPWWTISSMCRSLKICPLWISLDGPGRV